MDGVDGIAGLQAVIAGLGWAFLGTIEDGPELVVLGMLIAGSSLGFLVQNWQPAKIFMGDVGAAFLGYELAANGARRGMRATAWHMAGVT